MEWDAAPGDVQAISAREELSARNAACNARSRGSL